jgi:hypothetical protein
MRGGLTVSGGGLIYYGSSLTVALCCVQGSTVAI